MNLVSRITNPSGVKSLKHRPSASEIRSPVEARSPNIVRYVCGRNESAGPRLPASRSNRTTSALSAAFHGILVSAGLVEARPPEHGSTSGLGRSGRRRQNELSFHSLRHSATTMLKMAGAAEATVREIIGHNSALVSRLYTHVGDRDKREALAKLAAINLD